MEKLLRRVFLGVLLGVFFALPWTSGAEETISIEDAVLKTLRANPGVKIQKAKVEQQEGLLQTASGQFDWVGYGSVSRRDANAPLILADRGIDPLTGLVIDSIHAQETRYELGAVRPLRSGIKIAPSISTQDYKDDIAQVLPANQVQAGIEIVIPLLRGLGVEDTGANELAARSNLLATDQLTKYYISRHVYQTAVAYWECLKAREALDAVENAIDRVQKILSFLELLVKGGLAAPDVLSQARAKIMLRESDKREAALTLYRARQNLALAMGYTPEELPAAPVPGGAFPGVLEPALLERASPPKMIAESLNHREDYKAGKTGINTELILSKKAEKQTRPRLDFDVRVGYAALDESNEVKRYLNSFSSNANGPNVYAGLVLELPIQNNAAKGEAARRRAIVRETELSVDSLANSIGSDVLTTLEALKAYSVEYGYASESRLTYERAVKFETTKLEQGAGSLTTLIQLEDDHLTARLSQLNAIGNYAGALAKLRFVSGTLLHEEDKALHFRPGVLTSLPFVD